MYWLDTFMVLVFLKIFKETSKIVFRKFQATATVKAARTLDCWYEALKISVLDKNSEVKLTSSAFLASTLHKIMLVNLSK